MTVRLRLTLWYTALLGATLIFFSVVVYSALATNLQAYIVQDSSRQAGLVSRAIGTQIERDILLLSNRSEKVVFPDLDYFTSSIGVQIANLQGMIIAQSDNLTNVVVPGYTQALPNVQQGLSHVYVAELENPLFVYSEPLVVGGRVVGMVQVVRAVGVSETALNQVSRYLVIGTGLSLVVAAVVGAFLARRELAPLATITQTASGITRAKDLDKRLSFATLDNEIGKLAATFNEMLDRIQQLFHGQERLVADVSHDLRTPLTTIQGNMELLQRMASTARAGTRGDNELFNLVEEIIDETANETERMSKLINDLLLLAQADSGVLKLQMEPVEMDTLLLDIYRQTRRMAEHKRGVGILEIRLGGEDQALVFGDRGRLRQVLLNLTDNAIKYTPNGGTITLGLENSNGWVKVAVQDTGIGISPEQQQHIFERFYRTDKARSREKGGSGLGLSIVQWIAQAHNGHVTVQSELQHGSTFTLWLPEYLPELAAAGNGATETKEQEFVAA
jgi:two-component system OmpR family sensor kinase